MKYILLYIFFAHILGDFYGQWDKFCEKKREEKWNGKTKLIHALLIFILSWVATCSWCGWWLAGSIAATHWTIDVIKALCENNIKVDNGEEKVILKDSRYTLVSFLIDQLFHIGSIVVLCYLWTKYNAVYTNDFIKSDIGVKMILCVFFVFLACKPSNILVTQILKFFQVSALKNQGLSGGNEGNTDDINDHGNFKGGALIGSLERLLMISFIVLSQYEAIGFLIAAKSILRFSETKNEGEKSEYVLAGTFLSVSLALLMGYLITKRCWIY